MTSKPLTHLRTMDLPVALGPPAVRIRAAVRLTLAVVGLLVTVAAPLDAQPVRQGERVRAQTTDGVRFVGVVSGLDTESLLVRPDGGTVPVNLAFAEIQGLERSIGQRHHGRKWATYGVIAGGGIGVLSGLAFADHREETGWRQSPILEWSTRSGWAVRVTLRGTSWANTMCGSPCNSVALRSGAWGSSWDPSGSAGNGCQEFTPCWSA